MNSCACREKGSLYSEILRARKLKLQREKRIIDSLLSDRVKYLPDFHIDSSYVYLKPSKELVDHYSDSQYSVNQHSDKIIITKKQKPKLFFRRQQQKQVGLSEQEALRERARRFVMRLRKQKEYNQGKMMLMRKKQEERHQLQIKRAELQRREQQLESKKSRANKVINNILYHEERISHREAHSLNKLKTSTRAKTENTERVLSKSVNIERVDTQMLLSLKQRVKEISDIISTYQ